MNQKKKPFHETVAENLIKQLEQARALATTLGTW